MIVSKPPSGHAQRVIGNADKPALYADEDTVKCPIAANLSRIGQRSVRRAGKGARTFRAISSPTTNISNRSLDYPWNLWADRTGRLAGWRERARLCIR